jgi:hypothetical protein
MGYEMAAIRLLLVACCEHYHECIVSETSSAAATIMAMFAEKNEMDLVGLINLPSSDTEYRAEFIFERSVNFTLFLYSTAAC